MSITNLWQKTLLATTHRVDDLYRVFAVFCLQTFMRGTIIQHPCVQNWHNVGLLQSQSSNTQCNGVQIPLCQDSTVILTWLVT